MILLAMLLAGLGSAPVRDGCESAAVTEHAIRQLAQLDWADIRMTRLQDLWPYQLMLREQMATDGETSEQCGPEDGTFLLGYDGRVIAGDRECGDYFVVDQRAGRERGLILMHLVRRYETAEAATEASKALLRALGVLK